MKFEQTNSTALGSISRRHESAYQARQQENSPFADMPNDVTTRQAFFLDDQRR